MRSIVRISLLVVNLILLLHVIGVKGQPFAYNEGRFALSDARPQSCQTIIQTSQFYGTCCSLNSTASGGCVLNVQNGWCQIRGQYWGEIWNSTDDRLECPPSEWEVTYSVMLPTEAPTTRNPTTTSITTPTLQPVVQTPPPQTSSYTEGRFALSDARPQSCQTIIDTSLFYGTCCSLNSTASGGCVLNVQNGWCRIQGQYWGQTWNSTDDSTECLPSEWEISYNNNPTRPTQRCFLSNKELLAAVKIYIQAGSGDVSNQVAYNQLIQEYGEQKIQAGNGDVSNQVAYNQLIQEYGEPIGSWCTSQLMNFSSIFGIYAHMDHSDEIKAFDEDISGWDTSSATDMSFMFFGAESFNQNIAPWATGLVTNFESMFAEARTFNQPIGSWDTSNAQNFKEMFRGAFMFNQNLNGWDTPNLVQLAGMFNDAKAFNGDISSWDVNQVQDFSSLFLRANNFNSNIGSWKMQNALNFQRMFSQATSFNQDIGSWKTGQVSDFLHLFDSAEAFNQDIGNWNTSSVTNMANCFRDAKAFNQDVSGWDMKSVRKHDKMFMGASSFNQNLCAWKDVFEYPEVGNLFTNTSCTFQENPDPILKGPFVPMPVRRRLHRQHWWILLLRPLMVRIIIPPVVIVLPLVPESRLPWCFRLS